MGSGRYEIALKEQNNLLDIISDKWGEDSIKFSLNQINKAIILKYLDKQYKCIYLIRKTITNKRFRDHLKNNVFSKKLKSILNDIDKQSKEKLIADFKALSTISK